jgi:hypothetical protein
VSEPRPATDLSDYSGFIYSFAVGVTAFITGCFVGAGYLKVAVSFAVVAVGVLLMAVANAHDGVVRENKMRHKLDNAVTHESRLNREIAELKSRAVPPIPPEDVR